MSTLLKSGFSSIKRARLFNNLSSKDTQHYDVIIAGGGLVGTSLLVSLAKQETLYNKKILMLEGAPEHKLAIREKYSNRVSAINNQSIRLLKAINSWEFIETVRCKPILEMQVWDALSKESIVFNSSIDKESIACIVENDLMLDSMYKQLKDLHNVKILTDSKINECHLPKNEKQTSEVTLKSGDKFTCDLLVGADGFNSIVRRSMDVNNFSLSYKQMGVVGTLEIDTNDDNNKAWQRFLPSGPVALLPLSKKWSSLVWTTTPEHAKSLLEMTPNEFIDAVNEAFSKKYDKSSVVRCAIQFADTLSPFKSEKVPLPPKVINVQENSLAKFPLGFGHASSYVSKGAVLIGDAAHRVHPLAGQGVNLGFGDVLKLTEILSEATYNGLVLNDMQYLLKYERERLKANLPIMLGVHALQRLYCNEFTPVVLARNFGLKFVNSVPPIKKFLMGKAMA